MPLEPGASEAATGEANKPRVLTTIFIGPLPLFHPLQTKCPVAVCQKVWPWPHATDATHPLPHPTPRQSNHGSWLTSDLLARTSDHALALLFSSNPGEKVEGMGRGFGTNLEEQVWDRRASTCECRSRVSRREFELGRRRQFSRSERPDGSR